MNKNKSPGSDELTTEFYQAYWELIGRTLTEFGFDFKKWVKILYTDMRAKINIKGKITEYFEIQRSVRQGCQISMLLFVLAADILGQVTFKWKN